MMLESFTKKLSYIAGEITVIDLGKIRNWD